MINKSPDMITQDMFYKFQVFIPCGFVWLVFWGFFGCLWLGFFCCWLVGFVFYS